MRFFPLFAALAVISAASAQPKGWQVLKEKTNACQIAVPPDWHPNPQVPGMATGPDMSSAMVLAEPTNAVRTIPEGAEKVLGVDKMIENTPQRVFWAGKPVSYPANAPPVVKYHVTVPAKTGTCVGQITVKQTVSESMAKQLGDTVAPVK